MNDKERAATTYRLLCDFNLLQLTCHLLSPFYWHNHCWTSMGQPLNNVYLNFFLKQHCQFVNEFIVFFCNIWVAALNLHSDPMTNVHQKFPILMPLWVLATSDQILAQCKLDRANLDEVWAMCLWHKTKESSRHLPEQDFVQKTLLHT